MVDERMDTNTRSDVAAIDNKSRSSISHGHGVQNYSSKQEDGRDDVDAFAEGRDSDPGEREGGQIRPSPSNKGQANLSKFNSQGSGGPPSLPQLHPAMHGSEAARMYHPSGPYPNYGFPNGVPQDFRGHHPGSFHQMPPLPHQSHPGAPFMSASGPYHHPHPGYPGVNFHAAPYPGPHGYNGPSGMPYGGMHPMYPGVKASHSGISDSASVSSCRSKGSKSGKLVNQRKKRTIDGVHENEMVLPFRRAESSASTSSTVTAGNNTSNDTPHLTDDSPKKGLPPLSSRPDLGTTPIPSFEEESAKIGRHRREFSGASTASSLSVGGFSMTSYEGQRGTTGGSRAKASPKRRKGYDGDVPSLDDGVGPARFQKLSVQDSMDQDSSSVSAGHVLFGLSSAAANRDGITPVSKNTKRSKNRGLSGTKIAGADNASGLQQTGSMDSVSPISKMIDQGATPPLPEVMNENGTITDEHLLNRHLRGQSFTPLPHVGSGGETRDMASKSPTPSFAAIAPQLSWDAPSLGDLADWEEQIGKSEEKRPGSTTSMLSQGTRGISPAFFVSWKDTEEGMQRQKISNSSSEDREYDGIRLLSPHSDTPMQDDATTPLPLFFDHRTPADERENVHRLALQGQQAYGQPGELDHIQQMFVSSGSRHPPYSSGQKINPPPTPVYSSHGDSFGRSPRNGEHDFFPMFGMNPHGMHQGIPDRVRNLRGRAPPGGPMFQLPHLPPSHHPSLTSPIGLGHHGKHGMWGPSGGSMHHSPLRMPHIDLSGSKRKCVPLKPPVPSKFQGDMEKTRNAPVPEFTSLVNFPGHMSQKQSANLPEGMRCCVMCGQACPCSQNKKKGGKSGDGGLSARRANTHDSLQDKNVAIIPSQNKGLCTLCDVNVWVIAQTRLEIKWCKGCKNFRPWAAFGDKGLATKCLRCRDRQREKYALQKEEKEKARIEGKQSRMKI